MYYPKSQITTGLISNGNLIIKSTSEPYFGEYYAVSTGQFFTGHNPSKGGNIELIQTEPENTPETLEPDKTVEDDIDLRFSSISTNTYSNIKNILDTSKVPSFISPFHSKPTRADRAVGEYRRYFAKKTNELIYLEISKETYDKLESKDPTIVSSLYEYLFLPWSLSNNETNKKIVSNIERNNKWYGFSSYISRYLIKETQENLFTRGGEYLTDKGENYIGFYHIHPSKGPMVGAKHINSPHGYLFAVNQISGSQSTSEIGGNIGVSSTGGSMGYSSGTSTPSAPTGGGGGGY